MSDSGNDSWQSSPGSASNSVYPASGVPSSKRRSATTAPRSPAATLPSRQVVEVVTSPELSIPWYLRRTSRSDTSKNCWCLSSRHLLSRVEFAFRVAFIACLPPAALIANPGTSTNFVSRSLATTIASIVARETVGRSVCTVSELIRCTLLWLPVASIAAWMSVRENFALWWTFYVVGTFVIGALNNGFTRKLGLMIYTMCMLAQLGRDEETEAVEYPARLCVDALIGAAFGLAASAMPPLRTSSRVAQEALEQAFDDISVCYTGLSDAFWAPTNLDRSINVARIKFVMEQLNDAEQQCLAAAAEAEYEQFGTSLSLSNTRLLLELSGELKYALNSLMRAVEIVEASPELIRGSTLAKKFAAGMRQPLVDVANAADTMLMCLSRPQEDARLRHRLALSTGLGKANMQSGNPTAQSSAITAQDSVFTSEEEKQRARDEAVLSASTVSMRCAVEQHMLNNLLETHDRREETFLRIRREIFFRHQTLQTMEHFSMIHGFFMFHHRQFVKRVATFVERRRNCEIEAIRSLCGGFFRKLIRFLLSPAQEELWRLKRIITQRKFRILKEAFKTCLALSLSVLFFLQYEPDRAVISGPSIVALASGSNTGEAMQGSIMRLMGTLFGAVLGFTVVTIVTEAWQIVAGLTLLVFVCSFFRTGKKYGDAALNACFVAIAVAVPRQTSDGAMRRVQQNSLAIVIYVVVATILFPKIPSEVLKSTRSKSLLQSSLTMTLLLSRYTWFENESSSDGSPLPLSEEEGMLSFEDDIERRRTVHGAWIEECETQIRALARLLHKERKTLPLATEEPTLRRRPFPATIANNFFSVQERFAALHVTMLAAWRAILLDPRPGDNQAVVRKILSKLAPLVRAFSATVVDAFSMVVVIINDPHAALTPALTKGTLLARQQAQEILAAHRECMLETIVTSSTDFVTPRSRDETSCDSGDDVSSPFPPTPHHVRQRTAPPKLSADPSPPITNTFSFSGQGFYATQSEVADPTTVVADSDPFAGERSNGQFSRSVPFANAEKGTEGKAAEFSDNTLPISSDDSAGLHTLVHSILSVAYELRKLFVIAEQLQHEEAVAVGV